MIVQFLQRAFGLRSPCILFGPGEIAQHYIDRGNGITRECLVCEGTGWIESEESWTLICPACRKARVP